jgi:hypothetical protein
LTKKYISNLSLSFSLSLIRVYIVFRAQFSLNRSRAFMAEGLNSKGTETLVHEVNIEFKYFFIFSTIYSHEFFSHIFQKFDLSYADNSFAFFLFGSFSASVCFLRFYLMIRIQLVFMVLFY